MAVRNRDDIAASEGVAPEAATRGGAGSFVYGLIVVAAVVVAIGISARFRHRWDWSAQGVNVLTPMTRSALDGLEETVTLHPLFPDTHPAYEPYRDLLFLFRQSSGKVKFEFIDPVAEPGRVRKLDVKFDQAGSQRTGITVAVRGDRRLVFRGTSEQDVTNALLALRSTRPRVIGFVRGYGELDPESPADLGMSKAAEALRQEYYDVRSLRLADGIPAEVTALILAGPHLAIPSADLAILDRWLAEGGRLLALLEPGEDFGINPSLARYGLSVTADRVVELGRGQIRGNPEYVSASSYSGNPIVRGFRANTPTAFPTVGAVVNFEPGDPTVFREALVSSSPEAVALTADGRREQGKFDLAAASWKRVPGAAGIDREVRVIAVGDSQFAANAYLPEQANRNLFLNMTAWLAQAEGLINIRRHPLEGQVFAVTPQQLPLMIAAFIGPALGVLLFGIVVFFRRRGR